MKWICDNCKAINAELCFTCHNCGEFIPFEKAFSNTTDVGENRDKNSPNTDNWYNPESTEDMS